MWKIQTDISKASYEAFVQEQKFGSIYQSAAWAQVKQEWDSQLVVLVSSEAIDMPCGPARAASIPANADTPVSPGPGSSTTVKTEQIIAAALILKRNLGAGKSLWYIPRGPVLADSLLTQDSCEADVWHESKVDTLVEKSASLAAQVLEVFLSQLGAYAKANGAAFVRIDPPFLRYEGEVDAHPLRTSAKSVDLGSYPGKTDWILPIFTKAGYVHRGFPISMSQTIQPRFNTVVYSEDSFPQRAAKALKRYLPKAQRRGVQVNKQGKEGLDALLTLLSKTEARKGITLRSRAYFERLFAAYGDDCQIYVAHIDLAQQISQLEATITQVQERLEKIEEKSPKLRGRLEEELRVWRAQLDFCVARAAQDGPSPMVAVSLAVRYGDKVELLYGGMDGDYAKIPAQFYLDAYCIEDLQAQGYKEVSFGGVEGSLDCSLLAYKEKFAPRLVEFYGEFDFVCSRSLYIGFNRLLPAVKKMRKFLKKKSSKRALS